MKRSTSTTRSSLTVCCGTPSEERWTTQEEEASAYVTQSYKSKNKYCKRKADDDNSNDRVPTFAETKVQKEKSRIRKARATISRQSDNGR